MLFGSGKSVFQMEGTARAKPLSTASAQPAVLESLKGPVQVELHWMRKVLGKYAAASHAAPHKPW